MKNYIIHLIECQCILPIYKKSTKPIYHKFKVFSEINDDNSIKEKYVSCNNCDSIHKVTEVFKSDIIWGNDTYKNLITTKNDIKFNLINEEKSNIVNILEENDCEISIWEKVNYIIENRIKEDSIIISKEVIENNVIIKKLIYKDDKFKVKKEVYQKDFLIK